MTGDSHEPTPFWRWLTSQPSRPDAIGYIAAEILSDYAITPDISLDALRARIVQEGTQQAVNAYDQAVQEWKAALPTEGEAQAAAASSAEAAQTLPDVGIVSWDWKGQPRWDQVTDALNRVFDGQQCPTISPVPDTHGDEYAVVVAPGPLTGAQAQAAWNAYLESEQ